MFPSRDLNNSNQNANWQLAPVYSGKCMEIISGQQKDKALGKLVTIQPLSLWFSAVLPTAVK